jgi:N-acetylglucosaminyl-diphospho-decaprenol L-rhamnosyltransferase
MSFDIPILSIIVVAYRSCDELPACLNSLPHEFDHRRVEVCVVNNSVGDGLSAWLSLQYPSVRLIEPVNNLGFGRANNLGFSETAGECVLFLNPDTICNDEALKHCLQRVLRDPTIGLISPKLVLRDGSLDLACRRSIPTLWDGFCRASGLASAFPENAVFAGYNLTHLPIGTSYPVGAVNGAFMLGRRQFLEQISEPFPYAVFDERFFMYGDDLDLCIRVAKAGKKIIYDGGVQILHLKGQSVAKEYSLMSRAIFDANRDVYLKHFGGSIYARVKWRTMFGVWKFIALARAKLRGYRAVRPL